MGCKVKFDDPVEDEDRFEYYIEFIGEPEIDKLKRMLNMNGRQGWELASYNEGLLIMKRSV